MITQRVNKNEQHDVYIGRAEGGDFHFGTAVRTDQIGRRGWLGNHYKESEWGREKSVELFTRDLGWVADADSRVKYALIALYGKRLGCYCRSDQCCHGDALVRFVNNLYWANQ